MPPAARHRARGSPPSRGRVGQRKYIEKMRSCWLAKWSSPLSEREIQEIQEHEREIQEIEIWTKKTCGSISTKINGILHSRGNATATLRRHLTSTITPP